ncbi:MAG: adaptor protein MecA [Clostridia bacterium]|nr:adaptor protein MecA [Clostridia bacterium]
MKIERLNENQIRCTLNKSDLASRQLKINELAYGSDKAKELFRDMMQQASYELGFEAEDTPVMIEAIPVSSECIVLIVTKVDNPEELDTRFSRFSPSDSDDDFDFDDMETIDGDSFSDYGSLPTAEEELDYDEVAASEENGLPEDELMNIFNRVKEYFNKVSEKQPSSDKSSDAEDKFIPLKDSVKKSSGSEISTPEESNSDNTVKNTISRVFSFNSIDDISDVAGIVDHIYHDSNMLYKNKADKRYYLVITKENVSSKDFNRVCNILSEYGTKEPSYDNALGFFTEHCECIISRHALHVLSRL